MSPTCTLMEFTYQPDLKELDRLAEDVQAFGKSNNLHQDLTYGLNLCLDELLTNIISYGFKDQTPTPIELKLSINDAGHQLTAVLTDKAKPFNPLELLKKYPDLKSDVDERAIGGLGVFFVNKYMDAINYQRNGENNQLTLKTKVF